jgi:hypothetical protein
MQKPIIFISHIHEEEPCANALEKVLRKALLGALDIFNTSNRTSIAAGDPWRDKIVEMLKRAASVLVIASPNSVSSPWVNFEAGGAWVSGTRVIPCCIKGMTPSSLPAPLSHLQALDLSSPEDLHLLINHLAEGAGLDAPAEFDFSKAAEALVKSWDSGEPIFSNDEFISWFKKVNCRPAKYRGQTAIGYFHVKHLRSTDPQETRQFGANELKPGDAISCWLELDAPESLWSSHCFASGPVADLLETVAEGTVLYGTIKCLGQMKVYETVMDLGDEERGVSHPTAWLIVDAKTAQKRARSSTP